MKLVRVNDRLIFVFVYPAMAILSVHIGNENSLLALLQMPSYYTDLLLAFACTFGLGFYYRRFFKYIHVQFNYDENFRKRIVYQSLFGVLFPTAFVVLVEILYLHFLLNISLSNSSVFYLEMPIVATFCSIINLLYTVLYFRKDQSQMALEIKRTEQSEIPIKKQHFMVNSAGRSVRVSVEEIAHFSLSQKSTILTTTSGNQFFLNSSLTEIMAELNDLDFFQLNRQVIAHRNSIISFQQTETRKLKIDLQYPPNFEVCVSKMRASDFTKWMNKT